MGPLFLNDIFTEVLSRIKYIRSSNLFDLELNSHLVDFTNSASHQMFHHVYLQHRLLNVVSVIVSHYLES